MFSKIKAFFHKVKELFRLYREDKQNRKLFVDTVKAQMSDRESFFSMYNIRIDNDNYYQIIYPINIPNEFQIAGQNWQILDKLNETSYIVSRFLKTELGYVNNISDVEYYHLEDPTNDNVSTTYIAVWNFVDQLQSKKLVYSILYGSVLFTLSVLGILSYIFIL